MSTMELRLLVVGNPAATTRVALGRLASLGWGSHFVATLREAQTLIQAFQFDVVLASECLPDGRGYELTDAIIKRGATLFVSVTLSESCLWLSAVERGEVTLGKRAFGPALLAAELEALLSCHAAERARRPWKTMIPPRRKPGAAATAAAGAGGHAGPPLSFTSRDTPGGAAEEREKRRA